MTVFGIKNCNTVKSALQWLTSRKVAYTFHDYKSRGVDDKQLRAWCKQEGWERLINKKGTTWKQLQPDVQGAVRDVDSAIALMKEKPSVIKRPLIEDNGKIVALGFDEELYKKIFS